MKKLNPKNALLETLRNHVSGAIARGEKEAIAGIPAAGYSIAGKYQTVGFYSSKAEAEAECRRMNFRGGTVYRVILAAL